MLTSEMIKALQYELSANGDCKVVLIIAPIHGDRVVEGSEGIFFSNDPGQGELSIQNFPY